MGKNFILTEREAIRQDLRWRRAVGGSIARLAVPPEMLTIRFANRSMGGQQQA